MRTHTIRTAALAVVAMIAAAGSAPAQSSGQAAAGPDRARLVGAWHMVSMEEQAPDGKLTHRDDRDAMLVYTADGHVSVQVMYPASDISSTTNSPYSKDGYEASFGSYDVDEQAHTVTHHVRGSLVRTLIGRDLPRVMQFSTDGHLTLRSARPEEKWSVTWEHD